MMSQSKRRKKKMEKIQTNLKKFLAIALVLMMIITTIPISSMAYNIGDSVYVGGTNSWVSGFYYNFSAVKTQFGSSKYGSSGQKCTEVPVSFFAQVPICVNS